MKNISLLVILTITWAGFVAPALADELPGVQRPAKLDTQIQVTLDYLLYLPKDDSDEDAWPLMLFLHGAGERGDNLELVKKHGPPKLIAAGKDFPCIVVSPQCPADKYWEPIELIALIDDLSSRYKIDQDRIYVTGLSMGGYGTWRLAACAPQRLAAITPICGRRGKSLDKTISTSRRVGLSWSEG